MPKTAFKSRSGPEIISPSECQVAEGCRVQEYKSRTLAHRTGSAFVQMQAEGGALANLHDHALRASDTGTQAGGGQETGAVQRGTDFCDLRIAAAVGVPTTVPTVRIEAMISTEPKFSKKEWWAWGESNSRQTV